MNRIGPYEVLGELGRGGMGVVYRARDPRLDRTVAIKALPPELASDLVRLERFEREARTLAQLNHPNLVGIHGLEEHEGRNYLVLEFVEGETLADRLDRGPLPPDEAVEMAIQIAAGVEAAHEAGVIHRDLKPANIIVTPDGRAKVLDFGLARTDEGASSSSVLSAATLTSPVQHSPTVPGVILGTAAYMSPEQARGRRVDKRTDIWSFGVILYEMLTGASPFAGETVSDSIGAVLHKTFELDRLPEGVPWHVRRVLARCLQRDKDLRYRDIGDARLELTAGDERPETTPVRNGRLASGVAAAGLLLGLAGLGYGLSRPRPADPEPPPVVRFGFEVPVTGGHRNLSPSVALSPDGGTVAVQVDDREQDPIFVRRMDRSELREIELPWPADLIDWTPDGRWLIVKKDAGDEGELWRVSPTGESPRLICRLPEEGFLWADSVTFLDQSTLLFGMASGGLWTVPLRGGEPTLALAPEENELFAQPRTIMGTEAVAFLEINAGRVEALVDGQRRVLFDFGRDRLTTLEATPDGGLLVGVSSGSRSAGVYRMGFDARRLEVTSSPLYVMPLGDVDIAPNGTMAHGPRVRSRPISHDLVWVDRGGAIEATVAAGLPNIASISLSPDSARAAVSIVSAATLGTDQASFDIAVIDLASGARYELADSAGSDYYPFWRSDGKTLMYSTYNAGIRRTSQRDDSGAGDPQVVFPRSLFARPTDDGRYLVFNWNGISYLEADSDEVRVFADVWTRNFDVSTDGRFIAYTPGSTGSGIRLQRFPDGGAMTSLTTMEAWGLAWAADDSELYFWSDDTFWSIAIDLTGAQPVFGAPEELFSAEQNGLEPLRVYGVGPGGRFLMARIPEGTPQPPSEIEVHVVQNWLATQDGEDEG